MKQFVARAHGKLTDFSQGLFRAISRLGGALFGSLSWSAPGWLKGVSDKWSTFHHAKPLVSTGAILGLLVACCGSAWSWHYYKHLPKAHRVTVQISDIPVTKLEKDLIFPSLRLTFSDPGANLADLHKVLSGDGVRLEPSIPGEWRWEDDRHLTFRPSQDWPADQKFHLTFKRSFFPKQVMMERLSYELQTPPFTIAIKELKLYQDPNNPAQRQFTATLEASHPIVRGGLEQHLKLALLGGSTIFPPNEPAPHFTVSYGLHDRLAYLRTSRITLPGNEDFLKLILSKGARSVSNNAVSPSEAEEKITVPSVATVFRIGSSEGIIARNKSNEPEQIVMIQTTSDISTAELARALEIKLLPTKKDTWGKDTDYVPEEDTDAAGDDEEGSSETGSSTAENDEQNEGSDDQIPESHQWMSPDAVPAYALKDAHKIDFTALPSSRPQDQTHTFRIRVEKAGELYVHIRKGITAPGNYPLAEDYNAVMLVPSLPREVKIEGDGGLLALNGERKLSIRSRGLKAIEYEVARVATSQINHLVSQTEGRFQHPQFAVPDLFNQENISRMATEHQSIAMQEPWKANFSAFDISRYLAKPVDGGSERGLFFLSARGWDPVKNKQVKNVKDGRFLLVTDIGIVTKQAADNHEEVFLLSIKQQKPIGGATVQILGKNGIALQTAQTAADGHCSFTSVVKETRERSPVAIVAQLGDDISFIPYARQDRVLNFSRFDVDGVASVLPESLDAFVFTERGIYRPGDVIHAGLVVKRRDWGGNVKGLPLEIEVLDARDTRVQTKNITLPESGFTELTYETANESATGLYTINVFLVKNRKRTTLLGSTTAQVKEFLPDRMKINARLSTGSVPGWINPADVKGLVSLSNLYGTPAAAHRITARIELSPSSFGFRQFPGYVFYDSLQDEKKEHHEQSIDLGEKKTGDDGTTEFDLNLERFADATYAMHFITEGFEADGGRSVTTDVDTLVSSLPYVIGCKPDADLAYVEAKTARTLELIALDPKLERTAVENVTVNVLAQDYVSVLTKQENGNYAFESVLKERLVKTDMISVPAAGARYPLPTDEPGTFLVELRDNQNRRLSKTGFCVVGRGTTSRSLEKNAELEVKLNRAEYNSGDDVAISITAPYAGSGLITIERDHVYAYRWFQASTASSVQHITVPTDFEGSGYINVSFVRALDSKEIYVSPLSYGVAHFTANREKRALKVEINAPEKTRPGQPLHIRYKADRPSQIVIFAVDQGILQVTDFKTPDPLGFYFRKCSLAVQTAQIVDQLVPEFSLLRAASAFGGGGDNQRLNPFKRVTEKPVVYWSGILDADATEKEVTYDVPDFFDGTLRIMAVAVARDATGSSERESLVRGPFVITPSMPVLAAPGDEFEAGVTIANNVEGSGADSEISLEIETSSQLAVNGTSKQTLRIAEGKEQTCVVRFKVKDELGAAEVQFKATGAGQETMRRATLSVRPPVPFITEVRSGNFRGGTTDVPVNADLYAAFRKLNATVSSVPLGLARGLDAYLQAFPHGCSEQITSGAFCRLILSDEADFGLSRAEVSKQMDHTFGVLARRQNDQGLFGYWAPESGDQISFVSVYVMDFLTEAKAAHFAPLPNMQESALLGLQKMVKHDPRDLSDARIVAYAIYILTREGVVTTNYILNLKDYLEKNQKNKWQNDLTGVYLAGALHLLQKQAEAERLVRQYHPGSSEHRDYNDFCQPLGSDSQYLAVLAREFPEQLKRISADQLQAILRPIGDGNFNTLSAAYAVRALKAYSGAIARDLPEMTLTEVDGNKTQKVLARGRALSLHQDFSPAAKAIKFGAGRATAGVGAFFQVVTTGYDRKLPKTALSNGLEVYRELLGSNNRPVASTRLGDRLRVRLHVRSLTDRSITNVAIVDLLPGGFEVVDSSVHAGVSNIAGVDYVDLREDRAVFFADVPGTALEINYEIKSCNRGEFTVPPPFAESMYDRNTKARGTGGKITVTQ